MSWHQRDPRADKFCPHRREFFPNGKLLPCAQPHCQDHKPSAPGVDGRRDGGGMSAFIKLDLPIPPSANKYWVSTRGRGMVPSHEAIDYKNRVRLQTTGLMPLAGPVDVRIRVYRARRAGDLDGFLKVALDALNGRAWLDDSQVVRIEATRHDDKKRPRLELEATADAFATIDEVEAERVDRQDAADKRRRTRNENRAAKLNGSRREEILQPHSPTPEEGRASDYRKRAVPSHVGNGRTSRPSISMRELLLHELEEQERAIKGVGR